MTTATVPPPGYELTEASWGPMYTRTSPTCDLGDGLVGHYVRPPTFSCFQAAIATAIQAESIDAVPDITEVGELLLWGEEEGFEVDFRHPGVGERPMGLSIGVTVPVENPITTNNRGGLPARHTVILRDGVLFFDPTRGAMLWPNGYPPKGFSADQIDHVITLTRKEES